jgi:transposase
MSDGSRRQFTREFKEAAVRRVKDEGQSVARVASELGLHETVLRRWMALLEVHGPKAFPGNGVAMDKDDEIVRLRRELEQTRIERDILKKAVAIFSKPQP